VNTLRTVEKNTFLLLVASNEVHHVIVNSWRAFEEYIGKKVNNLVLS